jgi:hypothetical protein
MKSPPLSPIVVRQRGTQRRELLSLRRVNVSVGNAVRVNLTLSLQQNVAAR